MFNEFSAKRQMLLPPGVAWGLGTSSWKGEKWMREIEEIKDDSQISSLSNG